MHRSNRPRPRPDFRLLVRPAILALALAGLPAVGVAASTTSASAATCAVTWGSLTKSATRTTTATLQDVRAGRHDCYDRLVLDLSGPAAGYVVQYVTTVHREGSGASVPLRGGARLQIVAKAPAYDSHGATYRPADRSELADVDGFTTFRQVAWAGSYEGQTTVGLGVRARLPMRAFVLAGPGGGSRIVVDVAHHW